MPAPYNQPVQILQAHTTATAYLVGEIEAFIIVLILMNVLKDRTAAHATHIVLIHKAHTDVIATDVSTNLEVVAMVRIGYDHTSMVNSLSLTFKATSY